MYNRARKAIAKRFHELSLRVRCWNLPPVATHLACFLMGTLLFQPDTAGRLPPGVLLPWPVQKILGGVQASQDYSLVSRTKHCLMLPQSFRLWQTGENKVFAIVPKIKLLSEALSDLQKSDAWLQVKTASPIANCEKTNAIIYP